MLKSFVFSVCLLSSVLSVNANAQMIPNPFPNQSQQATQANVAASNQIIVSTNLKNATITLVSTAPDVMGFWVSQIFGNVGIDAGTQLNLMSLCQDAVQDKADAQVAITNGNAKLASAVTAFTSGTTAQFTAFDYGLAISWYTTAKTRALEAAAFYYMAGQLIQSSDQAMNAMILELL